MNLSRISLVDPDTENIWEDKGAKTVAFFCRKRPVRITAKTIDELKQISSLRDGSNVRVCLHSEPASDHHDMVILERPGGYYRPHRHTYKGDCFHIMEGQMGLFTFNENGDVIDCAVLEPGEIYRVEVNMYHAVMPLTDPVIYHENKPGPFLTQGDSLYPDWAPDGSDASQVNEYITELKLQLGV